MKKLAESILQDEKKCFITGSTTNLHRHHIMHGTANRKLAEEYGLWVWLRADWHNGADYSVHNDHQLDLALKRVAQEAFEAKYGHAKWMEVFGKNYIWE